MLFKLKLEPLTRAAFKPFGDVIEVAGAQHFPINQGFAERFNDLAEVDVCQDGGAVKVSIMVANPRQQPLTLTLMERHPLGSQMFFPLQNQPWLLVVCCDPQEIKSFRAFVATGLQGVNYARNTWHHPLLVFDELSRFIIVDRKGPGNNLEEIHLNNAVLCETYFP